jgi:hypothetical protein
LIWAFIPRPLYLPFCLSFSRAGTAPDKSLVGDRGEGSAPYNARKSALAAGGMSEFEYRVDAKLGMVGGIYRNSKCAPNAHLPLPSPVPFLFSKEHVFLKPAPAHVFIPCGHLCVHALCFF